MTAPRPPLPHRTIADTVATHVADHNALHDAYNAGLAAGTAVASSIGISSFQLGNSGAPLDLSRLGYFSFPVWQPVVDGSPFPQCATADPVNAGSIILPDAPSLYAITLRLAALATNEAVLVVGITLAYQHYVEQLYGNQPPQGLNPSASGTFVTAGTITPTLYVSVFPAGPPTEPGLQLTSAFLDVVRLA